MGVTLLLVRFPDETVRFGAYQDTVDVAFPRLVPTIDEYVDRRADGSINEEIEGGDVFDVDIYCDYGGGSYWRGQATADRVLPGFRNTFDDGFEEINGVPDWALKAGYGHEWIKMQKERAK